MSDFDVVLNRKGTNSTKWDKYRDQDIIPMWVADMDFRVPDQIIDAIKERAEHGAFGYNTPPDDLKDVIIKRMKTLYAWSVSDEQIYFLPGVVPGISQACRGLVKPDEAVVTATPIYHPFLAAPENFERDILRVPSKMIDGRWPFPVEGLRSTKYLNYAISQMTDDEKIAALDAFDDIESLVGYTLDDIRAGKKIRDLKIRDSLQSSVSEINESILRECIRLFLA